MGSVIRVKWEREEMVAFVDVFMRHQGQTGEKVDQDLEKLSAALGRRADTLGIRHDGKFRNLNGLHMQYMSLLYLESKGEYGLSSGSALMRDVLKMAHERPEDFEVLVEGFWKRYNLY